MENKYFTDIMGDISFLKTSSFIKKVKNNNIDFIFYKRSKKENVDTINFMLNLEKNAGKCCQYNYKKSM